MSYKAGVESGVEFSYCPIAVPRNSRSCEVTRRSDFCIHPLRRPFPPIGGASSPFSLGRPGPFCHHQPFIEQMEIHRLVDVFLGGYAIIFAMILVLLVRPIKRMLART